MTPRDDESEAALANAIRVGAQRRAAQAFGSYFEGHGRSCALGAAYDGIYHVPSRNGSIRPDARDMARLFDCLENTIRQCPEGCRKRLALGAIIVHLNDDHRWSRERIAAWVGGQDPSAVLDGY